MNSRWWAVLLVIAVGSATAGRATTFVPMDERQLTVASDAAVVGTVLAVGTAVASGRVSTEVVLRVEEALFGVVPSVLTLREPGGRYRGRGWIVAGRAVYEAGERALVFLRRTGRATFRTTALRLGKYRVVEREEPPGSSAGEQTVSASQLARMARAVEAEALRRRKPGGRTVPGTLPDAVSSPRFTLVIPPARWFEPDGDEPVPFRVYLGEPGGLAPATLRSAVRAALETWSGVPQATLRLTDAGNAGAVDFFSCDANRVVFGDPGDDLDDPVSCGGVLALSAICTSEETVDLHGRRFQRITGGQVTVNNGWEECPIWNACAIGETLAHEIGHVVGLGHSADAGSIMVRGGRFDGTCERLGRDDREAITFLYPRATFTPVPPTRTFTPTAPPSPTPSPSATRAPTASPTATAAPPPAIEIGRALRGRGRVWRIPVRVTRGPAFYSLELQLRIPGHRRVRDVRAGAAAAGALVSWVGTDTGVRIALARAQPTPPRLHEAVVVIEVEPTRAFRRCRGEVEVEEVRIDDRPVAEVRVRRCA